MFISAGLVNTRVSPTLFFLRNQTGYLRTVLWLVVLGYVGAAGFSSAAAKEAQPAGASRVAPKSNPRNEQVWVVESVVGNIAELAGFSATGKGADRTVGPVRVESDGLIDNSYQYRVIVPLTGEIEPLKVQLRLTESVWSVGNYTEFASQMLKRLKVRASAEHPGEHPIQKLTSYSADDIQSENQRISRWLSEHPADPEGHEQAALVIGVLGMRENSGVFWDARPFCNRATAHLALAEALRAGDAPSDSARVARLIVGLLDDRRKQCDQWIGELRSASEKNELLKPWVIAACLRNARDWRVARSDATTMERIELFRAHCESIGSSVACKKLFESNPAEIADWSRIVFEYRPSVGDGRAFLNFALAMEHQEIAKVFPEISGSERPEDTALILNVPPGGSVQHPANGAAAIEVIDRGTWAHFFQRHLAHVISQMHEFVAEQWGVPEEAKSFKSAMDKMFGQLTFYPLAEILMTPMSNPLDREMQARQMISDHPEWITVSNWGAAIARQSSAEPITPSISDWFEPVLLTGTAYDFYSRNVKLPQMRNLSLEKIKALHELAPTHIGIATLYLQRLYGKTASVKQMREILGGLLEYNVSAMRKLAEVVRNDPSQYLPISSKIAEHDPYEYLRLSSYLRAHQMEKEAVVAFETGKERGADPVGISNNCAWVVDYYFENGETAKAERLAEFAAEVYSSAGLATMGRLQERMGKLPAAESYFLKIQERYNDDSLLMAFYQRQNLANPGSTYAGKLEELVKKAFPSGLQEVTLDSFSGEPARGVQIVNSSPLARGFGLEAGTLILALDGKRTETERQYLLVRALTDSPEMDLIVYQDGQYRELHATAPNRTLNVRLESWETSGSDSGAPPKRR